MYTLPVDEVEWFNISDCPLNVTETLHSTWIQKYFSQCVTSPLQYAAFIIGLSSTLCWLVAQAPQIFTNCVGKKADEALSFWFLLQWFAGDVTNLLGALLTGQLATQVITAIYFVSVDTVMMGQFLFYFFKNQHGRAALRKCCLQLKKGSVLMLVFPCLVLTVLLSEGGGASERQGRGGVPVTGRALLSVVDVKDPKDVAGYIIGCISGAFYVCSRVPQIVKNFRRCSVEGLSLPMFVMAVLGNVTYALGVLLYNTDFIFTMRKLPWLVGSVGTLCFDFTIFLQFMFLKCCTCCRKHPLDEDDEKQPLFSEAGHHNELCSNCSVQNSN